MTITRTERGARPLVSVCMPTYNRAHMVGLAIESVLDQSYRHLELIVVNDGSTDCTREVLEAYAAKDSRIRVINKDNEGIPATVNRGWVAATGEFVTWTSDDNLYHRTALETLTDSLVQSPHVMLVYADHRVIDAEGRLIEYPECYDPSSLESHSVIYGCVLFRRSLFDHIGMFRQRWTRCHDFEFYRRVYKKYEIERIPKVLYDYRRHDASMTGDHFAITVEHAQLLDSVAETPKYRRAAWARCWHDIARQAERDDRLFRAVWYHLRAAAKERPRWSTARRAIRNAVYSLAPSSLQRAWRVVKRSYTASC